MYLPSWYLDGLRSRGTNTVNWSGNVVERVFDGEGDDTIRGNDASNDIYTSGGADTVYAGRGDDHIRDFDSRPDRNVEFDTIDCGPGDDRVYTVENEDNVSPDCEDVSLQ